MSKIVDFFKTARKGKKHQFEALLRPHVPLLYKKAVYWTGNPDDADDLLQDVLIKLADRVDSMREIDNLAPWLVRVLYRHFVDLYRKETRSPLVNETTLMGDAANEGGFIDNTAHETDDIADLDLRGEIVQALRQLKPELRVVFIMLEYRGYTVEEVADVLRVRPGTVKSRNHRAKKLLKKFLQTGTFSTSPSC